VAWLVWGEGALSLTLTKMEGAVFVRPSRAVARSELRSNLAAGAGPQVNVAWWASGCEPVPVLVHRKWLGGPQGGLKGGTQKS
jgi:hypothetical protein